MERISRYISFAEATKSNTAIKYGIDNSPNPEQLKAMRLVATEIFDKVREHFGKPIAITSFLRVDTLNIKVGGAKNSQHVKGQAIDIDADVLGGLTNKDIYEFIRDNLDYDQLINEFDYSWIHVSYVSKELNRNRQLAAVKSNGKTAYQLVD
jgi:hypothetical protein